MSRINEEEVRKALGKKAAYGDDIDMEKYDEGEKDVEQIESLEDTPDDLQKKMINVGVDTDDSEKDGTILFINNAMSHCSNKAQDGLIIMSTQKAMETYSWVKDYYWNAMDPAKDKYTAKTYEEKSDGYFIYVKPGHHLKFPVQTCMMLGQDKSVQNLHNIIVVDDDASCDMITGCTTVHSANDALHVGVSEMYIGENSSLSFTMIHSWNNETAVRPRTNVVMKKNARYVNNYVVLDHPVVPERLPQRGGCILQFQHHVHRPRELEHRHRRVCDPQRPQHRRGDPQQEHILRGQDDRQGTPHR